MRTAALTLLIVVLFLIIWWRVIKYNERLPPEAEQYIKHMKPRHDR